MSTNDELNSVLVAMRRSLLQYMAESWPWVAESAGAALSEIDRLVAEQGSRIERLCAFLVARRWPVDLGAFPDYTDLHFLGFDRLLPELAANHRTIVKKIETAIARCAGDTDATSLLADTLPAERATATKLEELGRSFAKAGV